MAFDIGKLFEDEDYVSPGSIGGKIKMYRELRGWSQKELGIRSGFSASTADVRIAQYEKNRKLPRENILKNIATALGVDDCTLFDADLLPYNRMYHALFDIEDFHGLHPVKKADGYYLEFSGPTIINPRGVLSSDYSDFLGEWYEMRQKCQPDRNDTPEEKAAKAKEYALWRGEYPHNVVREQHEKMQDKIKMNRLQAEIDSLYAKMQNDEELQKIDEALETVLPDVRSQYKPITRESELIMLVKSMIDKGMGVMNSSPEVSFEADHNNQHLLSLKTEEILNNNEEAKSLFARFVCALETLRQYGIDVTRRITSRDKELFLSYYYPSSQWLYFENLWRCWDDMVYIQERRDKWMDWEIDKLEEEFKAKITGENDVVLSEPIQYDDKER